VAYIPPVSAQKKDTLACAILDTNKKTQNVSPKRVLITHAQIQTQSVWTEQLVTRVNVKMVPKNVVPRVKILMNVQLDAHVHLHLTQDARTGLVDTRVFVLMGTNDLEMVV